MYDELVLADSAGHTMIDIEAVRALDRQRAVPAGPHDGEDEGAAEGATEE